MGIFYYLPLLLLKFIKKLLIETDNYTALLFTTQMKTGKIVDLDFELALNSAIVGKTYKLPLAYSIIYATALQYNTTLFTLDKHFKDFPKVIFF